MDSTTDYRIDNADVPALSSAVSSIARAGYSEKTVQERLGLKDLSDLDWRAVPMYCDHLDKIDPLDTAIELFLLQRAVQAKKLHQILQTPDLEVLVKTGLLSINEAGLARARAALFPVGKLLIFSDLAWPELTPQVPVASAYDRVMYIGRDSRDLARSTIRRSVRATLDLCTGSGIQALLAASHSQRVLAVDINPRAAQCTRLNAQALGIANLDVIVGDLFEPLSGERFDLITANPPFVPSPENAVRFRDGGSSGEEVQKRIISGLPTHLAPGGVAQMITELGERDNEPIIDRVRGWLNYAPIDVHILRLREHSTVKYAIGHATGKDNEAFLDSAQAWSANLESQGYVHIVAMLLSFQWSDPASGEAWGRVDEAQMGNRSAGVDIEAVFAAERRIRNTDLRELLVTSKLRRSGPIALLDAQVLGTELQAKARATLLGRALKIEHPLSLIERDVLIRMEGSIAGSELIELYSKLQVDEKSLLAALSSLLRRCLIVTETFTDEPHREAE